MAMLPSEIILEEILPKLPAKSLLRFKCVSKQFQTLISSPNFIHRHLHHSLSTVANRLLITSRGSGLHSFDLDSPENPPVSLPLPEFFEPDLCSIIGCCNGLLLLRSGPYNPKFVLMNPSTGFYTVIPYGGGPACNCSYGFGYDAINDDYKIVIFYDWNGVNVANLKDKLWRNLDDDLDRAPGDCQMAVVCDNHLCHWLIWSELKQKHQIVCFDLCIENWTNDVPLPDYKDNSADLLLDNCRHKRNDVTALQVMDGFLSVLIQSNTGSDGRDLWVMKEYGIKDSWVKLFGFSDPNCTPLTFGGLSNSKVLCKVCVASKYQLKWYNVRERQYNDAEIHDVHGVKRLYEVCVVNGSLVTVPGGKQIHDNDQGVQGGWRTSWTNS
ncbi:F-box protein CPR1-like [Silene latifolia]|uniref:F-box protein CPR1-like n=1 Tax=Silene latifolia TaxID=37657 RepID=UPI003D76D044